MTDRCKGNPCASWPRHLQRECASSLNLNCTDDCKAGHRTVKWILQATSQLENQSALLEQEEQDHFRLGMSQNRRLEGGNSSRWVRNAGAGPPFCSSPRAIGFSLNLRHASGMPRVRW